jgi:hypothetical protein
MKVKSKRRAKPKASSTKKAMKAYPLRMQNKDTGKYGLTGY